MKHCGRYGAIAINQITMFDASQFCLFYDAFLYVDKLYASQKG